MAFTWQKNPDEAMSQAQGSAKLVLLDFSAAPECGACARLDAEIYPDQKVGDYIAANFVPVKIHIKENGPAFKRFEVQWTPTIMLLDSSGKEHYRFEGYLPAVSFLAQLDFGHGRVAFHGKHWDDAAREFNSAAARDPKSELAAEAGYWAAVAQYKKTRDPSSLKEWGKKVRAEFPNTTWAKRALVYASE